jgi:hypothetical protein
LAVHYTGGKKPCHQKEEDEQPGHPPARATRAIEENQAALEKEARD